MQVPWLKEPGSSPIPILMVWLYNNTGKSVFGMVLFHTMINLSTVPDIGFPYDPVLASVILATIAAVVLFLWALRPWPAPMGSRGIAIHEVIDRNHVRIVHSSNR